MMAKVDKPTREFWLLGNSLRKISACILPTNRSVLCRFLFLQNEDKKTLQECARLTTSEIVNFWTKTGITHKDERNVIPKIRQLHKEWQDLKKNCYKNSDFITRTRNAFIDKLEKIFDISSANVTDTPSNNSSQALLALLKANKRPNHEIVLQIETIEPEIPCISLKKSSKKIKKQECELSTELFDQDDSEIEADSVDSPIPNVSESHVQLQRKKKKIDILSDDVCAALDRTKVSNRNFTYLLAPICQALNYDIQDVICNHESIRRRRLEYRERIAGEVKRSFDPETLLTVHWDTKLLSALKSKKLVIVSGENTIKLLGVPAIQNGTGKAQADAVYKLLEDWNLTDQIVAMCFDTTASNTGLDNGACTLLEKLLGDHLLALACRHHVMELPLSSVFNVLFEPSSGPNIKLFMKFQKDWERIDKTLYKSALEDDDTIVRHLIPVRDNLITFFRNQLENFQPRDDYRELLQLALLFLGAPMKDNKVIVIIAPGALHRARFMAKIIYSLKIYLFREQFPLRARELIALRQFNIFAVRIYLKNWYMCQKSTLAPWNDLILMKELLKYEKINSKIAKTAFTTMSRHSWYLSETLVGLAFFEPLVPVEVKRAMVSALKKKGKNEPVRRIKIDENLIPTQELPDFVTQNTRKFFTKMKISEDFLEEDPSLWPKNESYLEAREIVLQLKVVNDAAERGISLIQDYNSILTNQEDQKQYLLQGVEKHRHQIPNAKKSTIMKGLNGSS